MIKNTKGYLTDYEIECLEKAFISSIFNCEVSLFAINKLIELNEFEEASELLKKINDKICLKKVETKLDYLNKKIKEKLEYEKLDDSKKERYNKFKEFGRHKYDIEYYEEAFDYYNAGLYVTKNNVFNYYIGKMYYKVGNFVEATKYLNEYNKYGAEKYSKSRLYLIQIYRKTGKKGKAIRLLEEINNVAHLENYKFRVDALNAKCIMVPKEEYKNPKILKMIKMTEEDFKPNES